MQMKGTMGENCRCYYWFCKTKRKINITPFRFDFNVFRVIHWECRVSGIDLHLIRRLLAQARTKVLQTFPHQNRLSQVYGGEITARAARLSLKREI